jgi:hypothetical protein
MSATMNGTGLGVDLRREKENIPTRRMRCSMDTSSRLAGSSTLELEDAMNPFHDEADDKAQACSRHRKERVWSDAFRNRLIEIDLRSVSPPRRRCTTRTYDARHYGITHLYSLSRRSPNLVGAPAQNFGEAAHRRPSSPPVSSTMAPKFVRYLSVAVQCPSLTSPRTLMK